jgi:hypothetical protein
VSCTRQERAFIEQVNSVQYNVKMGFVPNMNVPGTFYVNDKLKDLLFEELAQSVQRGEVSQQAAAAGGSSRSIAPACVCVWHLRQSRHQVMAGVLCICSACATDTPCLHLCDACSCACAARRLPPSRQAAGECGSTAGHRKGV